MRLMILARSLEVGGAERQLILLARAFRQRGHEVVVALFYGGGALEPELHQAGVRVVDLGKGGRWDILAFCRRLFALVRKERPDIIHGYLPVANLLSLLAARAVPGCRVAFGVRASNMDLSCYDRLAGLSYRIEGLMARGADLAISNSEAGRRSAVARGFPSARTVVVPNGIDTGRFRPDPLGRQRLRAVWGVPEGCRLIGLVGRLDPMKGHQTFLAAARIVADRHADVRFVCVGAGDSGYRSLLEVRASELGLTSRLTWAPPMMEVEAVYNALDLLVSASSFGEGFSNVLAEAMACGVPVVATAVGDALEVVGSCGAVVEPGDAQALAEACCATLERLPQAGPPCRDRVEELFGVETMAARTEALLAPLAADRRPLVLHLITGLGGGGAERMLTQVVIGSAQGPFRQMVVSMTGDGRWGATIRQSGVIVHDLAMWPGVPSPAALLRLVWMIRRERPAVVMTWLYHADLMGSLAMALARTGARLVWNLRCSDMDVGRYGVLHRLLARLSSYPDGVAANAQAGRRFHARLGYRPKSWVWLPNGVDTDLFRPPQPEARAAVRAAWGIPAEGVAVGLVARVDAMKDHATFFAAAVQVARRRPETVFVLVGRGVEQLEPPPRLPVVLLPECAEVPAVMGGLDLLVLTSAFGEGFPNVVAEGMACGLPVVTTDVGDAATVVGDTGTVVPPRDAAALAEAIIGLVEDGESRARQGAKARARAMELWSLEPCLSRYAQLWQELSSTTQRM